MPQSRPGLALLGSGLGLRQTSRTGKEESRQDERAKAAAALL